MPGMFAGHMHCDAGITASHHYMNVFSRADVPPGVLMVRAVNVVRVMLESGFTSYVGAGCSADNDAALKMAIETGLIDGPRITASGRHLNTIGHDQDSAKWWYEMDYHPFDLFLSGAEEFRKAARSEVQRGVEILKICPTSGHGTAGRGPGLTLDEMQAVVQVARDRGKKVRAHCVYRDAIIACIKAGVDVIDHGDETDEECVELMVEHGTTWCPSMKLLTILRNMPPNIPNMPVGNVGKDWDNYCRMLPIANDAGVNIVPGDDYGGAAMPHRPGIYAEELSMYANEVGVKPLDVLRWATVNGARLSGQPTGEIVIGKLADLVVVDGDPSSDITILEHTANVKTVMIDGRIVKDDGRLVR
jgi:imidazolonepropionase-like amidohydrolase